MLFELAADHGGAVRAEGMRQRLEAVIFLYRIDHDIGRHARVRSEKVAEPGEPGFVVAENPAIGNPAAAPVGSGNLLGGNTDQDFVSHELVNGKWEIVNRKRQLSAAKML